MHNMLQSPKHLKLVSLYSSGLHRYQISFNRAPFGCFGMGIHIMDAQLTNLQQPCDAITSVQTKISEEHFSTLLNFCIEELRMF